MQINTDLFKNKQRIYIGGNHGVKKIYNLVEHVLTSINKPTDFYTVGDEYSPTDAPIVLIKGGDELKGNKALFHQLDIHILLIHRIDEDVPEGYSSFEEYIGQFETLADNLPKAGTFLFYEGDNVATLMGKKEREDIRNIEYSALTAEPTSDGYLIIHGSDKIEVKSTSKRFPAHSAAAKALLNRIGVSDAQFFDALKSYS
jgi:UDP-N-acetylmuramate: L-alanyl-gamma-D-glutamyl-meso-diaminopimelate ligase